MKALRFVIFIVIIQHLSCTKPYSIKFSDIKKRIVVHSLFSPASIIKIKLTEEAAMDENLPNGNFKIIENALIVLFEDNKLIDTAYYDKNGYYYTKTKPQVNRSYKIVVTAEGYDKVTAEDKIPEPVPIDSLSKSDNNDDFFTYLVKVFFTDPENRENYYLFTTYWYNLTYKDQSSAYYRIDDPVIGKWVSMDLRFPIFNDELLNKTHIFDMQIHAYGENLYEIGAYYVVNLMSISRNMYLFMGSYNKQVYTTDDENIEPFLDGLIEPSPIYSNVEGGLGIFAGYAVSKDSVYFDGGK